MRTDFHNRARAILDAAGRLPAPEQAAHARRVCAGDGALLREVMSLLPHFQHAGGARPVSPLGTTWRSEGTSFIEHLAGDQARQPDEFEQLPDYIDQYRVLDVLGRGGMGIVYRGVHVTSGRRVAIKVLQKRLASQEGRLRFAYEAEILRQLKHPGIAAMIYANMVNNAFKSCNFYFVMEHVEGSSLTEYAREKELSLRDRLELMIRICDVVEYAHQRGIIHLDLKPSNILVHQGASRTGGEPGPRGRQSRHHDGSGVLPAFAQPKILDFGIAQIVAAGSSMIGTKKNVFAGTPQYASPEQLACRHSGFTPRSDVYALGLIAHELLVGRLPDMCGERLRLSLGTIRTEDRRTSSGFDDRLFRYFLGTVLARALHANDQKRYRTAGELGRDLAGMAAGLSPRSRWRRLCGRIGRLFAGASPTPFSTSAQSSARHMENPLSRPLWAVVRTRVAGSMKSYR